jgi:DNA excision repair protein ERCC-2
VPEIDKALAELKRLIEYRKMAGMDEKVLGLGLSSRKNLCIHPVVSQEKRGTVTDSKCRSLTTPWIRENPNNASETCEFFEELEGSNENISNISGAFTFDDFKSFSKQKHYCPYFYARKLIPVADVIIYSYHYLLDPKEAEFVSKELSKDSIVVFDEAHNIDNVCTEALSISKEL